MIARISDNHWVYLEQLTQGSEDSIIKHFSVRDPRAHYIDGSAGWDGWYRKYDRRNCRITLPFLEDLKKCCDENNIPLDIHDERPAPEYPKPQEDQITNSLITGMVAEPYQVDAWRATTHHEIGLINSCTGSGKTEIMAGIIKLYRCPTVVITESVVVLKQIVERLTLRGVVHNDDIGLFCHGNMPEGNLVIVGSIQSLSSPSEPKFDDIKLTNFQAIKKLLALLEKQDELCYTILPKPLVDVLFKKPEGVEKLIESKYMPIIHERFKRIEYTKRCKWFKTRSVRSRQIQEMVKQCDLLLIDETDLATSKQYTHLCKKVFNGRRRYGVSGTCFDPKKPINNLFLKENLGSIIYEVDRKIVQERGRIIPIKCTFIAVGLNGNKHDSRAFDIAMKEEITENPEFHQLVAKINSNFVKEGNLILLDTSPIESLGLALESLIPNSKFLYNKSSQKDRNAYVKLFEKRELQCMIGGRIFKRGLDLAGGCENLIIVGGGKQDSSINQMIGRAVRINSRGWARVFCFFFFNNKYLYDHSKQNLKTVVNMGYNTQVFVRGKLINGAEFIKSRFRIPK